MKSATTLVAVLMMLMGAVWVLQGINVLPGSFMTGQTQWALYGAMLFAAGAALLAWRLRG